MECLLFGIAVLFLWYTISGKRLFFYCGRDEDKYEDAFIGILMR